MTDQEYPRLLASGTNHRKDAMGTELVDHTITMKRSDFNEMRKFAKRDDEPLSLIFRRAMWHWIQRDGREG